MVNPRTGCGVQQTREPSRVWVFGLRPLRRKPSKPGGTARTEHVRDVAVPGRSLDDGSGGSGRRDGRVGEGAIDEPHERSPTKGTAFGPLLWFGPREPVRLCRGGVSESRSAAAEKMQRSIHGVVAKANEPSRTGCQRRRARVSALAVKSLSSSGTPTSRGRGYP